MLPMVLLVEDDSDLCLLMEKMLVRSGFGVLTAADAIEAARTFADRRTEIGLLIADLDLPFLSGLELAAMITSVEPALPVLIVSGTSDAVAMRDQIDSRGWLFLAKPFAMTELAAAAAHAKSAAGREAGSAEQTADEPKLPQAVREHRRRPSTRA